MSGHRRTCDLRGRAQRRGGVVLNAITGGLQQAAVGYSQTEAQFAQTRQQFSTQLSSAASSAASGSAATPTSAPPNVGNTNYTAVTEDFS